MASKNEQQGSWWIYKQLRSQVMTDLQKHIPENYFSHIDARLKINKSFNSANYLESEMQWGYKAGTLGKKLFFDNSIIMTAKERSASEVLMHLGLLATAEVSQKMCEELAVKATERGIDDGNSNVVSKQLKTFDIPTFQANLQGGLTQYLKHLQGAELAPFIELTPKKNTSKIQKLVNWATNNIINKVLVALVIAFLLALFGLK